MTPAPVPCRPNCMLACPLDAWSTYLLDDDSDHPPGWRLGHLIGWGRIPSDRWTDALAMTAATYDPGEVIDALRYLADHWTSATFTAADRQRAVALLDRWTRATRRAAA